MFYLSCILVVVAMIIQGFNHLDPPNGGAPA